MNNTVGKPNHLHFCCHFNQSVDYWNIFLQASARQKPVSKRLAHFSFFFFTPLYSPPCFAVFYAKIMLEMDGKVCDNNIWALE